jgi:hypothetical protein
MYFKSRRNDKKPAFEKKLNTKKLYKKLLLKAG